MRTPEKHSARICGVPRSTVPLRLKVVGFRTVEFARRITSNPLSPAEPLMKTEMVSCKPADPVMVSGEDGQDVPPAGRMQTTPVVEA